MGWEFEGLFDGLVSDADNLMADYWKSEPTAIRVGAMGYRTKTIKAGTRLEAEVYPLFGREKTARLRKAKKQITPDRQKALNIRRSQRKLVLLIEANFQAERDVHVTLTYAHEVSLKQCKRDLNCFLRKVRRIREERGLHELKYIYVIGHDEGHRIHAHVIMNGGIDRTELEQIWGRGYANCLILQSYGNGLQGIANYLFKQNDRERELRRKTFRSWSGSRNLKKPKEHTSDTKMTNAKVKRIARDFRNEAKEVMQKIYPGYSMERCDVFYSDMIDGVYIRCVMRKWPEQDGSGDKRRG